jgi:hypothetical protein
MKMFGQAIRGCPQGTVPVSVRVDVISLENVSKSMHPSKILGTHSIKHLLGKANGDLHFDPVAGCCSRQVRAEETV